MKSELTSELTGTGDPYIDGLLEECLKVFRAKGKDYTMGTGDALHNFKTVGEFTGTRPEVVWSVYAYKHLAAIFAYVKSGGQHESEPIRGRIIDAINYLILLGKMVDRKTDNVSPPLPSLTVPEPRIPCPIRLSSSDR